MMEYERLTVEEIEDFTQRACVQLCPELTRQLFSMAVELIKYKNKIDQGLMIELPCKVGDTVYYETFINNGSESVGIQPHEVKSIYTEIKTSNFSGYGHTIVRLDDIGKTVFLTREEA